MRRALDELYDVPFDFVTSEMVTIWLALMLPIAYYWYCFQKKGVFEPSFLSKYLEEHSMTTSPLDDFEELAKAAGASLYSGTFHF